MAQSVVDVLEAVEIEEDDGDARAVIERGRGTAGEEYPVGKSGEHVVRRLVGLAVHLVAKFLHQAGALQVGTGVGDESPEESEIVLVEVVEVFVTVQSDDGADNHGLTHEWSHDGTAVLAHDVVVAGSAVVCAGARVERRFAGRDGVAHERRRIEIDQVDSGRPTFVQ